MPASPLRTTWLGTACLLVAAAAWLVWVPSSSDPALRWWHAVVLLSCGVLMGALGPRSTAAGFSALAIAGAVAQSRALVTPPFAIYPFFLSPSALWRLERASLAVLIAQGVLVLMHISRLDAEMRAIGHWMRRHPVRTLVAVGLIGGCLVVPTRSVGATAAQLVVSGVATVAATLNIALVAHAVTPSAAARLRAALVAAVSLPGDSLTRRRWDARIPFVAAAVAVLLTMIVSVAVFEGMPHIDDSVSYLFQARVFADGRLFVAAPPDSAAFQVDEVLVDRGRWFGYGFPGWPAVLSLGVRAGVPWLVNPVLAGLMVLAVHAGVCRTADRGTAHLAAVLFATSPWALFMSAEFMPHPLAALCVLTAILASLRGSHWSGVVPAGLSLGVLALVRPLDAALAALVVTGMLLLRDVARPLAVGAVGIIAAAVAALVLPYNRLLTGVATYTPQMMWTDRRWGPGADRIGFGSDIGIREWSNIDPLPGHSWPDVLLNLNKNLFMTHADLFGWSMGSLVFCVIAVATVRRDAIRSPWWWLATVFVLGYSAYWFSGGPDLGARYWYPAVPALVALTLLGARELATRWNRPHAGLSLSLGIGVASIGVLVAVTPSRAMTKYYRYRNVGRDVEHLARSAGIHDAVVFVRSRERSHYQSAFHLNSVPLGSGNVYARDVSDTSRARVLARFPGRPVWVIGVPGDSGSLQVLDSTSPAR